MALHYYIYLLPLLHPYQYYLTILPISLHLTHSSTLYLHTPSHPLHSLLALAHSSLISIPHPHLLLTLYLSPHSYHPPLLSLFSRSLVVALLLLSHLRSLRSRSLLITLPHHLATLTLTHSSAHYSSPSPLLSRTRYHPTSLLHPLPHRYLIPLPTYLLTSLTPCSTHSPHSLLLHTSHTQPTPSVSLTHALTSLLTPLTSPTSSLITYYSPHTHYLPHLAHYHRLTHSHYTHYHTYTLYAHSTSTPHSTSSLARVVMYASLSPRLPRFTRYTHTLTTPHLTTPLTFPPTHHPFTHARRDSSLTRLTPPPPSHPHASSLLRPLAHVHLKLTAHQYLYNPPLTHPHTPYLTLPTTPSPHHPHSLHFVLPTLYPHLTTSRHSTRAAQLLLSRRSSHSLLITPTLHSPLSFHIHPTPLSPPNPHIHMHTYLIHYTHTSLPTHLTLATIPPLTILPTSPHYSSSIHLILISHHHPNCVCTLSTHLVILLHLPIPPYHYPIHSPPPSLTYPSGLTHLYPPHSILLSHHPPHPSHLTSHLTLHSRHAVVVVHLYPTTISTYLTYALSTYSHFLPFSHSTTLLSLHHTSFPHPSTSPPLHTSTHLITPLTLTHSTHTHITSQPLTIYLYFYHSFSL
ncbi:hypothetical protein C7M84_019496 [Penaeus vannamei]|uniref:Uncharacterized protein n=1 Tax=Penaeus vannamei TaxID=6689 RepID=A0A3R7PFD5_PENVA|nr:hypothetical protein C7M84_019496 [Penaeus vannamei]